MNPTPPEPIPIALEQWQTETQRYIDKLVQTIQQRPDIVDLRRRVPPVPLDYIPSPAGGCALQLMLFAMGCEAAVQHLLPVAIDLLRSGRFVALPLLSRAIYELWGAVHYARKEMEQFSLSGDTERCVAIAKRLLLGRDPRRPDIVLPWGGLATQPAVRAAELVRSLQDVQRDAIGTWGVAQ